MIACATNTIETSAAAFVIDVAPLWHAAGIRADGSNCCIDVRMASVKNLQYHYRSKVTQVKLSAGRMLVDVPVLLQRSLEFVQHLEHVNQTALPLPSYHHEDLAGMSESELGNMLRSPSVIRTITRPPLYPATTSASL